MTATDRQALDELCSQLESASRRNRSARGRNAVLHVVETWGATLQRLRIMVEPAISRWAGAFGLSVSGFESGLEVMLGGARREVALRLAERAAHDSDCWRSVCEGPCLKVVSLTASPPLLAVQAVLPALCTGSPLLVKVSSREPRVDGKALSEILVDCLREESSELGSTMATVCFRAGSASPQNNDADALLEILARRSERFVAYGGSSAIESLKRRFAAASASKLVVHGPKLSLAFIDRSVLNDNQWLRAVARGLAYDTALFDQRGCLSLHWVFTDGELIPIAERLDQALAEISSTIPSGTAMAADYPAVQSARAICAMTPGSFASQGPVAAGTVLATALSAGGTSDLLEPSPGGRSVRVYKVPSPAVDNTLKHLLRSWKGWFQGVAVEIGTKKRRPWLDLAESLEASHLCQAGELQRVDADWANGGYDPAEVFRATSR